MVKRLLLIGALLITGMACGAAKKEAKPPKKVNYYYIYNGTDNVMVFREKGTTHLWTVPAKKLSHRIHAKYIAHGRPILYYAYVGHSKEHEAISIPRHSHHIVGDPVVIFEANSRVKSGRGIKVRIVSEATFHAKQPKLEKSKKEKEEKEKKASAPQISKPEGGYKREVKPEASNEWSKDLAAFWERFKKFLIAKKADGKTPWFDQLNDKEWKEALPDWRGQAYAVSPAFDEFLQQFLSEYGATTHTVERTMLLNAVDRTAPYIFGTGPLTEDQMYTAINSFGPKTAAVIQKLIGKRAKGASMASPQVAQPHGAPVREVAQPQPQEQVRQVAQPMPGNVTQLRARWEAEHKQREQPKEQKEE